MGRNKWDNKFKFTKRFWENPLNSQEHPWTPSKQILKPPNFKTIPPTLFPPCETAKMTRRKLKISEFQNTKTKNFQNSHEERHIPRSLACENFTQFFWKPPRWQEGNWKRQNTKTKNLRSFQKKSEYPISPFVKLHTKKL